MAKINIFSTNNDFQRKIEISKIISEFKRRGLVPVLNDGNFLIYKISSNEKINELQKYYESNFFDIYDLLILDQVIYHFLKI